MSKSTKTDFRSYIESYPDFPKPGVMYRDFTKLLADPDALHAAVEEIEQHFKDKAISKIAAIEAKGFTLGAALAYRMRKPLLLIRKPELVPGEVDKESFIKEYGSAEYQLKRGQLAGDDRVLIVYDIMAGPGATSAAINLVRRAGANVAGCAFIIELAYLGGREQMAQFDLFSLVKFDAAAEV